MFTRKTSFVWIGILILSGMFLMGQQSWSPGVDEPLSSEPATTLPDGYNPDDLIITESETSPPSKIDYHYVPVGISYDVTLAGQSHVDFGDNYAELRYTYKKTELLNAGLVEEFVVYYYDETDGSWKPVDQTVADTDNSVVIAYTSHFSTFVLTAMPSSSGSLPEPPPCIALDFPATPECPTGICGTGQATFTVVDENFTYYQDRRYFIRPYSDPLHENYSAANEATFNALGFSQTLGISTKYLDRYNSDLDYIVFTAHTDLDVYVLYDSRGGVDINDNSQDAPWLRDNFINTGYFIQTSDKNMDMFRVYKNSYNAGETIHLHGNKYGGASGKIRSNYFVILKRQGVTREEYPSVLCVAESDPTAPPLISNLQAFPSRSEVTLTWQNPDVSDFAGVVIRRSIDGPVMGINDGEEPTGVVLSPQSYRDERLRADTTYFYTVFCLDENNNYLIGAAIDVFTSDDLGDLTAPTITEFTLLSSTPTIDPNISFTLTGNDNVAITGWMVKDIDSVPGAGDTGWMSTAPSEWTLISYGTTILYAWVKDAAGNVSDSSEITIDLFEENVYVGHYIINDQSSLDALAGYTEVTGVLSIGSTSLVSNLDGLEYLFTVGEQLKIINNTDLIDITGLRNLQSVSSISIQYNDSLTNLNGLEKITSISNDLLITQNDLLENIDGLSNLTSVGDFLTISSNPALTSLEPLSNVGSDVNYLRILYNDSLTNLNGLENITTVNEDLDLVTNRNLVNIDGLANIISVGNNLTITSNISLPDLGWLSGLSNLTTVGGDLTLRNNDLVTDYGALAALVSIGGNLNIIHNDSLTDLGLPALTTVNGDFTITDNPVLPPIQAGDLLSQLVGFTGTATIENNLENIYDGDYTISDQSTLDAFYGYTGITGNLSVYNTSLIYNLDGLEHLIEVGGDLTLSNNIDLVDIDGLSNITSVGGSLFIFFNSVLTSLAGLSNITSVGVAVIIGGNDSLPNLNGLNNITSVPGWFRIQNNFALTSLIDLNNITSVGGDLEISGNTALTDLNGLSNITSVGSNLEISDNVVLPTCEAEWLRNNIGVENIGGTITISNNCDSCVCEIHLEVCDGNYLVTDHLESVPPDLLDYTQVELSELSVCEEITGDLAILYNDALTNLADLENLTSVGGSLGISFNTALISLEGLENLTSVGGVLGISDNDALTSLSGLENLTSVGGNLGIAFNAALTNLSGLENLTSVGGSLSVGDNATLTNLDGLSNITSVGGNLTIQNNAVLMSLGMTSLTTVNGNFRITDNPVLFSIRAEGLLSQLVGFTGTATIENNNEDNIYYGNYRITDQLTLDAFYGYTGITGYLLVYNTSLIYDLDGLEYLTEVGGDLSVVNNTDLVDIDGLNNITSVGGNLFIVSNSSLTSLAGLSNITAVGIGVIIRGNDSLSNLNGLGNITAVGGDLEISGNDSLSNLNGLGNITAVDGDLEIFNNAALTSLGLSSLTTVNGNFTITNNPVLLRTLARELLKQLTGFTGAVAIENNLTMATIPVGCYDMGDAFNEGNPNELPMHEVCISGFEMDVHEVTNSEYAECVNDGVCPAHLVSGSATRASYYDNPAYDDFPVIMIEWSSAHTYCSWAGKRLPTEAEWEYAARGGLSSKRYPWGDTISGSNANYHESGDPWEGDTSPVEYYAPNGYGLYDMAGNVWEWIIDLYYEDFYTISILNNPFGPVCVFGWCTDDRLSRGGSFSNWPNDLRVARRGDPSVIASPFWFLSAGFRCARPGDCTDIDHDGYGNPASNDCIYPELDCDDTNANIFPGAPELCDGIDNQCPGDVGYGMVDEGELCGMAIIPAGCFDMGNPYSEWFPDQLPLHEVCISAFQMDIHEITNAEYAECVVDGGCTEPSNMSSGLWDGHRPSYYGDPAYEDFPVIYVNWFQVNDYCTWAGKRLPTEAEWEYAARGGLAHQRYVTGDSIDCSMASYGRYDSSSDCFDFGGLDNNTHHVQYYAPNGYGLYDMDGNVVEWTNDWYGDDYYSVSPMNDPSGPPSGTRRVLRGGSWLNDDVIDSMIISSRGHFRSPDEPGIYSVGGRCAR